MAVNLDARAEVSADASSENIADSRNDAADSQDNVSDSRDNVSDSREVIFDSPESVADSHNAFADSATDAGGFTPLDLGPRLVTWLDASREVVIDPSGLVQAWMDLSTYGNNAYQTTPANRPMLLEGSLNGRSVIRFDGTYDCLSIGDAESLNWLRDDFLVEVVMRYINTPGQNDYDAYGLLWAKTDLSKPYYGPALIANTADDMPRAAIYAQLREFGAGVSVASQPINDGGTNDGQFRVVGMRRFEPTFLGLETPTLEVRIQGISEGSATVSSINLNTTNDVFIGSRCTGGPPMQLLKGDIAEIVAVRGVVSDSEIGQLEAYLLTKYAL
jgi:hypothetical protein